MWTVTSPAFVSTATLGHWSIVSSEVPGGTDCPWDPAMTSRRPVAALDPVIWTPNATDGQVIGCAPRPQS